MKVGVLALQGAFAEHVKILRRLGVQAREVRLPEHLEGLDGLILPGGESTTFGKLAVAYGLVDPLRSLSQSIPMWGTCAGLVFLSGDVGLDQTLLGVMDIVVERNAFGRQVDSFEEDLEIKGLPGGPFHGVFIRAPRVLKVGPGVEVLATVQGNKIVAVRQQHFVGTSFHPELTDDDRFHQYFLKIVEESRGKG
jgi:pyridoxal 5'-phosphate synthase pdxT subunit